MKKLTKFFRLRVWLLRNHKGFNFTQLGKELRAPYPSTYYTYLNLLVNAKIVVRTARGQYKVAHTDRLLGVTLQDLTNRVQVKSLRRKLSKSRSDWWQLNRSMHRKLVEATEKCAKLEGQAHNDRIIREQNGE